ncbi:Chromate transport protein [Anatilimnocola aggregata]|uniref:Chromate transport protein n=1 Tax=Anatilimnocola aggregata TaxID=2528021 RepID=A0A517YI20_9BACT|nr:chromate efflux transporter [Anatilimnocola aggregata]QDU29880.1 Chromate transport protein [Anatilimnocola aggregata]
MHEIAAELPRKRVTYWQAFPTWLRIAGLSFGGPTAQIAVMHRILVDEKKWVGESRFLHALNFCMLLPGPEAQQLATYIGWLMHGTRGALTAGLLFILPGFVSILALSIVYVLYQQVPAVDAVFFGLKAAILAVVLQAVMRIGSRVLKTRAMLTVAIVAFLAIFFLHVPFPLVILAAGVAGLIGHRLAPLWFPTLQPHAKQGTEKVSDLKIEPGEQVNPQVVAVRATWSRTLFVAAVWLAIWWLPIGLVALIFGSDSVITVQGVFFSKAALVTFGGAYSVLTYIAQEAVHRYGWLKPAEMLDGLGLAETTPGPLIMVVQFVAFLGAYHNPGEHLSPLAAGILGSVVTVWATFAPCFLYILTGAPWIETLRRSQVLSAGLAVVTAAVVGVVLNLAIWLAVHTVFRTVHESSLPLFGFKLHWLTPEWHTLSFGTLLCMSVAMVLIFAIKRSVLVSLAITVGVGLVWYAVLGTR